MSDIALANGCFDCFHYGHLVHLEKAWQVATSNHCTLTVAVTVDGAVDKGSGRPVFPLEERVAIIRALRFVDDVVVSENGPQAIRMYRPKIYVKGWDWHGKLVVEESLLKEWGGRVIYTHLPAYSSTKILTGELLRERIEAAGRGQG